MSSSLLPSIALLGLLLAPIVSHAGDEINTDRPDFVESSDVVGKGRVQLEMGAQFERDSSDGVKARTRSTPVLIRMGIGEDLEFRVETDGRMLARSSEASTGISTRQRGWSDTSLGIKWHVQDGDDGKPGMAWLLHADLDSGSADFRGQGVRPSLRFVAEWDLPQDFSVGVMPGVVFDRNADGKRFTSGIFAVTFGKAWTSTWRSFVELAAQQIASKRNGGTLLSFDTGVTYLVSDSIQVDLSLNRGLTHETPDLSWGFGIAFRF